MTTQRTLATDTARESARRIRVIIDQELPRQLRELLSRGDLLAAPEAWDGPGAAQFRGDTWPRSRQALVGALDSLDRLHGNAAQVLEHIFAAGDRPGSRSGPLFFDQAGYLASRWLTVPWLGEAARRGVAVAKGANFHVGVTGEAATITRLRRFGLPAFHLDFLPIKTHGDHFPLLDVASRRGLVSAKVHGVRLPGDAERDPARVLDSMLRGYRNDFRHLLNVRRTELAATDLLRPENQRVLLFHRAWPSDLPRTATVHEVADYIRRTALLSIPRDHVGQVRHALATDIRDHPVNYHLDDPPSDGEIQGLLRRVRSNGIDSGAIQRMMHRPFEPKPWAPLGKMSRFFETPTGRLAARAIQGVGLLAGVAGAYQDCQVIAHPDPNALGGAGAQRGAAAASLVGFGMTVLPTVAVPASALLGVNAVADWVPGVGEVVIGATAAYFAADWVYQNHEAIGHAFNDAGHAVASVATNVVSGAMHGIQGGLQWPPHVFGW